MKNIISWHRFAVASALSSCVAFFGSAPAKATPRAVPMRASSCRTNSVLFYFDRLPAHHFAPFGDVNRHELLTHDGTIYDKQHNFIEIPAGSIAPDIDKLQITVFRFNGADTVGVSRVVWNQPRVPGKLTFYRVTARNTLVDATRTVFPYSLGVDRENGRVHAFENAYLPRVGNTISSGLPETDAEGFNYVWSKGRFVRRQPPLREAE